MSLGRVLILSAVVYAAVAAACTVQTEDDSVPGNGKGWLGAYYVFTRMTGTIEDGVAVPFAPGTKAANHGVTLEGTIGFLDNFYVKADVPYAIDRGEAAGVTDNASGVGDVALAGKWAFVNSAAGPRAGVLVGASLPTGDEDAGYSAGVIIPKIMAVGGAPVGPGRLYAGVGYAYVPKDGDVDAGDTTSCHAAYDLNLGRGVTIPLEVMGYATAKDASGGVADSKSGARNLTVSPCVTYTIRERLTLCGGVMIPAFKRGWADDYDYQPHLTVFVGF